MDALEVWKLLICQHKMNLGGSSSLILGKEPISQQWAAGRVRLSPTSRTLTSTEDMAVWIMCHAIFRWHITPHSPIYIVRMARLSLYSAVRKIYQSQIGQHPQRLWTGICSCSLNLTNRKTGTDQHSPSHHEPFTGFQKSSPSNPSHWNWTVLLDHCWLSLCFSSHICGYFRA